MRFSRVIGIDWHGGGGMGVSPPPFFMKGCCYGDGCFGAFSGADARAAARG